jgi:lysyl-tRNA synthetase class 2
MEIKADDLLGQRQRRLQKLLALKELGINPYPSQAKKDHLNQEITDRFDQYQNKEVYLCGRLMSFRDHGKLLFADLQDESGKIQLFFKKEGYQGDEKKFTLAWEHLNLLDAGDFVEAYGIVIKTLSGQISLQVLNIKLLTKSLRPLPNSLADKEQQFRQRYLDLVLNPERQALFKRKAAFWQVSREFLSKQGFVEVETPVLELVTGGADAAPFVTHHNALDQDFYLRISTELYQKRLLGGGLEKIFTLAPNFRNEGLSDEHLQEYYQLEWYWAYVSYRENMQLVRELITEIAKRVYGRTQFSTRGHTFNLAGVWEEIDYAQIIAHRLQIDIYESKNEEMLAILKKQGVNLTGVVNRNRLIDNLWKLVRQDISGPAFLVNEPAFMSPLAKSKTEDPTITERFHVIIAGSELGNGYSELNDPQEQLARFLEQQAARDQGDAEAQMLDLDYVEMLEYGMPPCSGYGQSERLFWFLENITAREGTLFPQMKREISEINKKIYPQVFIPA